MSITSLNDLFVHTLKDIYYAEKQILKALPTMVSKAASQPLKDAFEAHRAETEAQLERLKEVFAAVGEEAAGERCPAIEGILEEAQELLGEIEDGATRDAALIAAAQAVEHYEITRYGTLLTWAEELGHTDALALMRETLQEEKNADAKLSHLAKEKLNERATA